VITIDFQSYWEVIVITDSLEDITNQNAIGSE